MTHDTDAAFSAFLVECVNAGPDRCPLAQNGTTAAELEDTIYALIETLKQAPLPIPASHVHYDALVMGSAVDYSSLKNLILITLYHPFNFPVMAAGLQGLLSGNLTEVAVWRDLETDILAAATQAESIYGIRCGDKHTRASTTEEILPSVERVIQESKIGDSHFTIACARWQMDAKERYTGDFKVNTSFPVLLVANQYDPVTPIISAYNVSADLNGSVVLEREGFGVSSNPELLRVLLINW